MPEALILEFDGVGSEQYEAVNRQLGIDPVSGDGDWPEGIIFHAGAGRPGGWAVFEIWESRDAQDRFMQERLGAALKAGGIESPPRRVEWLKVGGYAMPGA